VATQLPIGFATGEGPPDATSSGIAPPLPSGDFAAEQGLLGSAARQTLALQHPDLDLRHVQPSEIVGSRYYYELSRVLALLDILTVQQTISSDGIALSDAFDNRTSLLAVASEGVVLAGVVVPVGCRV
jgi:hypothetical protein